MKNVLIASVLFAQCHIKYLDDGLRTPTYYLDQDENWIIVAIKSSYGDYAIGLIPTVDKYIDTTRVYFTLLSGERLILDAVPLRRNLAISFASKEELNRRAMRELLAYDIEVLRKIANIGIKSIEIDGLGKFYGMDDDTLYKFSRQLKCLLEF